MYLVKTVEAQTPRKELRTSAKEEPIKTGHILLDWVARSIVCSWVLSPSSAINTIQKVVIIILNILLSSLVKKLNKPRITLTLYSLIYIIIIKKTIIYYIKKQSNTWNKTHPTIILGINISTEGGRPKVKGRKKLIIYHL